MLLVLFAVFAAGLHSHLPGQEDNCAVCRLVSTTAAVVTVAVILFVFAGHSVMVPADVLADRSLNPVSNPFYRGPPGA